MPPTARAPTWEPGAVAVVEAVTMLRLADLIAALAIAVVVLLPKASIEARPALDGQPVELDRISRLQDDVFREPENAEALLQLADGWLSFGRADWAIASLSRFVDGEARGAAWTQAPLLRARVHLTLATARAERLEPAQAVDEARLVETSCREGAPACGPLRARADLLRAAMQALIDQHIDPAHDPERAKREVGKALHPSHTGFGGATR